MTSLWKPYEDHIRTLLRTDGVPSVSMVETQLSVSTNDHISRYTYCGYDPVPAISPGVTFSSDSSSSPGSGSSTTETYSVKLSRPFRQMTKSGTNMANHSEYYTPIQRTSNPKMRRQVGSTQGKGTEYVEKRRRNNEAAKRSREIRKMKEDQLAVYLAWLEGENRRLNQELQSAKELLQTCVIQKKCNG